MKLEDGAVDTRRQPEIVGIDDETAHCGEDINPRGSDCRDGTFSTLHRPVKYGAGMMRGGRSGFPPVWGRLAQLVRALPLQGRGPGFESLIAHQ